MWRHQVVVAEKNLMKSSFKMGELEVDSMKFLQAWRLPGIQDARFQKFGFDLAKIDLVTKDMT